MKCSGCGSELPDGKKFCPNCGTAIVIKKHCPQCGAEYQPNEKFCSNCGTKVSESAPSQAPSPPAAALPPTPAAQPITPTQPPPPNASTPAPADQKAADGKDGESLRRHITVLFVDMKSSTELIRGMDPEEANEILFPAIQKLSNVVYAFSGLVISTAGDGLVAIFGAPKPLEDHALRSCMAGLAMVKEIKTVHKDLKIRVGLNTGEVLITSDGSKYDIIGAAVNLAARMEQSAMPDTIRLTRDTYVQVADSIMVQNLGLTEVKGFSDPIEEFELKGIKESKSLNELSRQFTDRTRFVNREIEFAQIKTLLSAAISGHGNTVSLAADSGFGKSRFMYEVVSSEAAKGCNIVYTCGLSHTRDIPLLPITNLFRHLFGITNIEENIETIKKQIAPFIAKIDMPQAMNAALSLVNILNPDAEWKLVEPAIRRKLMFDVGLKILFNYSFEKPLIIIIEDLHWVDSETELFIDALTSLVLPHKILNFLNYRPNEYHDHWINKPNYTRLQLNPLTIEAGSAMLENLLGNDPSLSEVKKKLLTAVAGNPFFLEELVLSLIAKKIFIGEPKKYRLAEGTSVKELVLPETIATIYQMKLDSLEPLQKKILQMASVIGGKFLFSQLLQLMDSLDEKGLRAALYELTDNQYIYESQLYPEPEYAFTYGLTHESAYNSMLKKNRKSLHQRILTLMEATLKEDQLDQLQKAAEHAFLSETWDKAFHYSVLSADKDYEICAFSTSAKLYERALTVAKHLTQDEAQIKKEMYVHFRICYFIFTPLGRFKDQLPHLTKALELAVAQKDKFYEAIIHGAYTIYSLGYEDSNEGLKHALIAHPIAVELKSIDALIVADFALLHSYLFLGKFKELFDIVAELEKTINGDLDYRTQWQRVPAGHLAHSYDCWVRSWLGDFATVDGRKEKWFASAKNLQQPSIPNACRFGSMAINDYVRGDFDKALPNAAIAVQFSFNAEVIIFVPIFAAVLAEVHLRSNKRQEAKEHIQQAIGITEKIGFAFISIFAAPIICQCLILMGEYENAREFYLKALKAAKERKVEPVEVLLSKVSAEIDLHLPNPKFGEIKQKLDDALRLTTEHGMLPCASHCHLLLAELHQKMGNVELTKSSLQAALNGYEKLGMKYWIDQVKKWIF